MRAPALPIAAALAAGIAADRLVGIPLSFEFAINVALVIGWGILFRSRCWRWSSLLLVAAVCSVGATWHHLRWTSVRGNDVTRFASDEPRPVRLIATLRGDPSIAPKQIEDTPSAIPQYDRSISTISIQRLVSDERSIPVSGLTRMEVSGHLLHVRSGDEVEVLGQLQLPAAAQNPGGFDFRDHLQASGIHSVLRCDNPDCVRRIRPQADGWGSRLRARLQRACERTLATQLGPQTAPLGIAMLLGTRTGMSDDLRTSFAESGAMHMLAISGINVGILAAFLWTLCRVVGISPRATTAVMIGGVIFYALVTDGQPPVMRASVMIVIWLIGSAFHRKSNPINLLSTALLVVLVWNPVDLFRIGPQLSFLAVMGLLWSTTAATARDTVGDTAPERLILIARPAWRVALDSIAAGVWHGYRTTAAVWLFTLPLILARFNLISPVGFLTDVLLMPWLTLTLWLGYSLMIVGLLLPAVAAPFAWGFDRGLAGLLWIVDATAQVPLGHFYIPGPPDWWLVGFYLLLVAITLSPLSRAWRGIGWRAMLVWTICGLAVGLPIRKSRDLRCTFLAVGHGGAILVEFPGGGVLLYDAGSMQNPGRARQAIQSALWQRGLTHVDALILSHPDVDHFNAAVGLMRSIPVRSLFVSPTFLDFGQSSVQAVCEAAAIRRVPIKLLWKGDRLLTEGPAISQVLHPPPATGYKHDNANSLVVSIDYAGKRILLTGDLEAEGLASLLQTPPQKCDILLAPHHGSLKPNSEELAKWARPEFVAISGGRSDVEAHLENIYTTASAVLSTNRQGALTFRVSPQGDISWKAHCATAQRE